MRRQVTALLDRASVDRLALEKQQGATAEILDAWRKWYAEARESVTRLPVPR